MKVVHLVVAGEIGGAERMLCDLAGGSPEHVVALFTPSEPLRRLFERTGLRVHDRGPVRENPASYLWRSLGPSDVAWLEAILRREQPGVVHLHTFASHVLGTRAALRVGARIVRTEHSTRVYDDATCWPFSRWSLRRCHAAVAVSAHVRETAVAKAPWIAGKIRVIHGGVDTARFAPEDGGAQRGQPFTFVLAARLERRKGVDLAIDALAEVEGARLDVVGEGPERVALQAHAEARGVGARVAFHGYLEDTRPVVARADAALSSSRKEGLGMANLEAMAMGRAVVTFPVGGVPEVVHQGKTGFVARDMRPASLAAAMREAMGDRARTAYFGEAARAFVIENCSVDAMRRAYDAVYTP